MGVIRQVEMTPALREPVSWHAVTRVLNRYWVVSVNGLLNANDPDLTSFCRGQPHDELAP